MSEFAPGQHFGKYRIIRLLGQGGMADVYEAEDMVIGRVVALKILPAAFARDQERAGRFAKEIQASAALDHPNIVSVFEVGEVDGLHYYTMSVLPGGDLKDLLRNVALDQAEAIRITREIAGALHYAHEKGFVHRDVKPENILFREDTSAVLTDFGIARAATSQTRMTATGLSIGTPHYMSPEQARGKEVDGRSDLYALGVVFHEMLTGKVPFDAQDSFAVGLMHINDAPPKLPRELQACQPVLDKLLAKEPEERCQSGDKLVADLDRLEKGEAIEPSRRVTRMAQRKDHGWEIADNGGLADPGKRGGGGLRSGLYWALGGGALAGVIAMFVLVERPVYREAGPGPPAGAGNVIEESPGRSEASPAASDGNGRTKSESEIAWEQTREVDTEEAYEAFLRRYGSTSPRADEARARRETLEEARVRAIERELVRLGRDVEVDGNLYNDADDEIRQLEHLLGRPVRGEGDAQTLAMLQSVEDWPEVETTKDEVANWNVGDVVNRAVLTRPALLPDLEDLGPMPLMELFQERVGANEQGREILAVVHGRGGEDSAWTRLNPAMVTIATRTDTGFEIIYLKRFGRFPNRDLFEGRLSDVELIPPVLKISWVESSASENFFFTDWLGLTPSGEIDEVAIVVPDDLHPSHALDPDATPRGGVLDHKDGEFLRTAPVFRDNDASCCPSGGRFTMYFDLEREADSVSFVATHWEHELQNGTVRTSRDRAEEQANTTETSVPSPAIHLPFNGSSKIADRYDLRMFGGMLYDDGVTGLALDFENQRTGSPFYKNHFASIQRLTASEVTVSLWFNFEYNAHDHNGSLYSVGSVSGRPGNTGFRVAISKDEKIWLGLIGDGNKAGTQHVSIDRNRWHFVTAVVGRDQIRLYVDGEQAGSAEVDFPFSFDNLPQYLGYHAWSRGNSGSSRFAGRIDELKVFYQTLDSKQVSALYDSYRNPN